MIAESAINALSYAAPHPDEHTRYASTCGAMNPNQPALIRSVAEKMGQGASIVIATDYDERSPVRSRLSPARRAAPTLPSARTCP